MHGQGRQGLGGRHPNGEPERAADAGLALQPDLAAHQLDEASADHEPEARSPEAPRRRRVGLAEGLEQAALHVRRDPDSGVADLHLEIERVGLRRRHRHRRDDLAALRELDGVADQVREDLTEAAGVAAQRSRHPGIHRAQQLHSLALRPLGQQLHDLLERQPRVEVDDLELEATGLDLREVEDVVEDRQQRVRRVLHGLHELALLRRQMRVEQQPAHAEHAVHRGANLVAHYRQELGLGACARLGLGPGLAQLGVARLDLGQHRVEALDEVADLVARAPLGSQRVVALVPHAIGQPREVEQRPGEDAGQHQRQNDARQDRASDDARRPEQRPLRLRALDVDGRVGRETRFIDEEREALAHAPVLRVGNFHEPARHVRRHGRPLDRAGHAGGVGLERLDQDHVQAQLVGIQRMRGGQAFDVRSHDADRVDQRLTELIRALLAEALPSLDQQVVDRRVRARELIGQHRQAIDLVQILLGALEQTGLGSHDLQAGHREQHREQNADPREGEELRPDAQLHRAAAASATRTHSSAVTSPT